MAALIRGKDIIWQMSSTPPPVALAGGVFKRTAEPNRRFDHRSFNFRHLNHLRRLPLRQKQRLLEEQGGENQQSVRG
jgi:hypothetical protein